METDLRIPVGKQKFLYGTLRGPLEDTLILLLHGLTGNKESHIFFNGARYFEKKKLTTFRLNFYDTNRDARKLENSTLSLLGKDLDTVVTYFQEKGVKKLFVIGHSFGGIVILLSQNKGFTGAVLWDTPGNPSIITDTAMYVQELDRYYLNDRSPYGFTIGKKMYEENKTIKPFELITAFQKPVKIISGGKSPLADTAKKFYELALHPKELAIIPGATHSFHEDGVEELLFKSTYTWIRRMTGSKGE